MELCSVCPWEGGTRSRAGKAVSRTFPPPLCWPSCRQHPGLGWAQPFSHTEDPWNCHMGWRAGVLFYVFCLAALVCCLLIKPCTFASPEVGAHPCWMQLYFLRNCQGLKQIKFTGNCRPSCCICWQQHKGSSTRDPGFQRSWKLWAALSTQCLKTVLHENQDSPDTVPVLILVSSGLLRAIPKSLK